MPYNGVFSNATKIRGEQTCDKYCKNTNIVVGFVKNWKVFSVVKTQSLNFFNPMMFTSLPLEAVMLVTLGELSATRTLELRNI